MKKRLIYILAFILCGTTVLSSCDDMLNVDSNRVEYEFDDWTLNDSVYSVLGILKAVQDVADRQVLINEVRADLLTVNEAKAIVDIQELSRSEFNLNSNKYLDVKDYYSIINNCNIYLARVDTTLEKNGIRLMLPEYVAVKSVRAWTYLQLAINYNAVPYFTEPILTHSAAEAVMNRPMLTREEIVNKLIAEILPYENPAAYRMPAWDNDGKVLKFGYGSNGTEFETKLLFVPIRMLLGELYLWKGDYRTAANFFYSQITGAETNETADKYADHGNKVAYTSEGGKGFNNTFTKIFAAANFNDNSKNFFAIVPFANTDLYGSTSELASVFSPEGEVGAAQVVASPGIQSLSRRQVYCFLKNEEKDDLKAAPEYSHFYDYTGDLRIKATTYSQRSDDELKTEYKNIVGKFNFEKEVTLGIDAEYNPAIRTLFLILQRKEHAYLRFAEALVGLERNGYDGAMELAMTVLKEGVKKNYQILQNPVYAMDTTLVEVKDSLDAVIRVDTITNKYLASCTDSLRYNFTDNAFTDNEGIHSRGSGYSKRNAYYALNDTCIARYLGETVIEDKVEKILRPINYEDSLNYIADLVIDELALELAWEGTRFGDLIRFAKAMGDNDVLAKRVAGRAVNTTMTYRHPEFDDDSNYDTELYNKLLVEDNWYLPLPAGVVKPVDPENVPSGELPNE